ncbi:UNKNOWN [Stylonychia lemnae]|uniref:Uncharacterized protein n=1 Tax=Stylonychia lemnae TaxID=5949 RepID=A0A078B585_STYLE|nr:UNKNOWN [Stylonychia lemnae]|eukprot:CDW88427.1 UNKNOWN [Stylonychia lemnae]
MNTSEPYYNQDQKHSQQNKSLIEPSVNQFIVKQELQISQKQIDQETFNVITNTRRAFSKRPSIVVQDSIDDQQKAFNLTFNEIKQFQPQSQRENHRRSNHLQHQLAALSLQPEDSVKHLQIDQLNRIQEISENTLKKYAPNNFASNTSLKLRELENLLDLGYSKQEIIKQMQIEADPENNNKGTYNFSKNDSEIKLIKQGQQPKLKILLSKQYRNIFQLEKPSFKKMSPSKFFSKYNEIVERYVSPDLDDQHQADIIRSKLRELITFKRKKRSLADFSMSRQDSQQGQHQLHKSQVSGQGRVNINFQQVKNPLMNELLKSQRVKSVRNSIENSQFSSIDTSKFINNSLSKINSVSDSTKFLSVIPTNRVGSQNKYNHRRNESFSKIMSIQQSCESQIQLSQNTVKDFKSFEKKQSQLQEESLILQSSIHNLQNLQMLGDNSQNFEEIKQDVAFECQQDKEQQMDNETLDKYITDNKKNSLFIARYAKRRQLWKPEKFKYSRKVKIAENYDQLLSK